MNPFHLFSAANIAIDSADPLSAGHAGETPSDAPSPPLPSPQPPATAAKQPGGKSWLVLLVCTLIGGVFGAMIGKALRGVGEAPDWMTVRFAGMTLWHVALVPLWMWLAVVLHELGHLAGGLMRGMRFLLLIVGPLRLRRTADGLRWDWVRHGGTFAGLAAAIPDATRDQRVQSLWLIAGGPLANLLLALLAFALAAALPNHAGGHALMFGVLSTLMFVVNALPMRVRGLMTDGFQFRELVRGGGAVQQRLALATLMAQTLSGIRPRDWDRDALQRTLSNTDGEPLRDVPSWLLAYSVALDTGEIAEAGGYIDRIAAGYAAFPAGLRDSLACEIAYFNARHRGDAATAERWMAQAVSGLVERNARARSEAAIALCRGDATLALHCVERAEAALGQSMDPGAAVAAADALRALRADAQALLARAQAAA